MTDDVRARVRVCVCVSPWDDPFVLSRLSRLPACLPACSTPGWPLALGPFTNWPFLPARPSLPPRARAPAPALAFDPPPSAPLTCLSRTRANARPHTCTVLEPRRTPSLFARSNAASSPHHDRLPSSLRSCGWPVSLGRPSESPPPTPPPSTILPRPSPLRHHLPSLPRSHPARPTHASPVRPPAHAHPPVASQSSSRSTPRSASVSRRWAARPSRAGRSSSKSQKRKAKRVHDPKKYTALRCGR